MMQRAGTSTQAQIFRDPERRATPRTPLMSSRSVRFHPKKRTRSHNLAVKFRRESSGEPLCAVIISGISTQRELFRQWVATSRALFPSNGSAVLESGEIDGAVAVVASAAPTPISVASVTVTAETFAALVTKRRASPRRHHSVTGSVRLLRPCARSGLITVHFVHPPRRARLRCGMRRINRI